MTVKSLPLSGWSFLPLLSSLADGSRALEDPAQCDCGLVFLFLFFTVFYFTILYWFCHTLTWIRHGCTWVLGWCFLNDLHARCSCAQSLQSSPTLCSSVDCSPPGSSIHGILQARILEWVAISFSRRSSWPRDRTWVSLTVDRLFIISASRELCSAHPAGFCGQHLR